jgi:hypothetical protein
MKITKTRLKQIIKEELDNLSETDKGFDPLADDYGDDPGDIVYPDEPHSYWKFIPNPPDQSSSDDDWYALSEGGYIKPEDVLADKSQIAKVRDAQATLESFFEALREAEIRTEM